MKLDPITEYILQEQSKIKQLINWLKDMGMYAHDMYMENKECKLVREDTKSMYLLHGTRPEYVDSIKRNGLKIKMFMKRTREENDLMLTTKPSIWFSYIYTGEAVGFGESGKPVVYMLAKVDTKYLRFNAVAYQYFKDIPPKDLIWQTDSRFINTIKKSPCLRYRKK